jgi:hypothetical protein
MNSSIKITFMKHYIFILLLGGMVLGCGKEEEMAPSDVKLDYYIESFNLSGLDFVPQLKVDYEYDNAGKLVKYTYYTFDPTLKTLVKQRSFELSYIEGRVDKIKGLLANSNELSEEYHYQYLPDSRVSKITEDNKRTQLTSEADFTYHDDSVKVAYRYSNGSSFEYHFRYRNKNISSDRTTRGSTLCSNGRFTYDQNKNPFSRLGYVDYLLSNLSDNNKLTENLNFVGCSFPTLVPESHSYVYDGNGYPTESTTTYKSSSTLIKSQKKFFYIPM